MEQLTHLLTKAKYINTRSEQAGYSSQHKLDHLGLLWCHSPKGYLLQSRRWPAFCTGQDSKFFSLVGQTVCCLCAVPTSALTHGSAPHVRERGTAVIRHDRTQSQEQARHLEVTPRFSWDCVRSRVVQAPTHAGQEGVECDLLTPQN